jgi:hypothetical protein
VLIIIVVIVICCLKKKKKDDTEKKKNKYKAEGGNSKDKGGSNGPGKGKANGETDMEMNPKEGPKSSVVSEPYIGFEASPQSINIKFDDKQSA